jgi:hypothetical protein
MWLSPFGKYKEEENKEEIRRFPLEIYDEIKNFDKSSLNEPDEIHINIFLDRHNFLREIRDGIELKHVEPSPKKFQDNFLENLLHTLQEIIVNRRIRLYGKDNQFAYTSQEYLDAYNKLVTIQSDNKHRLFMIIGTLMCTITGIGIMFEKSDFFTGMYCSNLLLVGSFFLCNFELRFPQIK